MLIVLVLADYCARLFRGRGVHLSYDYVSNFSLGSQGGPCQASFRTPAGCAAHQKKVGCTSGGTFQSSQSLRRFLCSSPAPPPLVVLKGAPYAMAQLKKLLGDIEAMLKKVDGGIAEFDSLMDNHKHASHLGVLGNSF